MTSQRGHIGSVKAEFELPEPIVAPLAAARPLGKTRIVVDGAPIAAHDLYPAQDVARGRHLPPRLDTMRLWFH